MQNLFDLLRIGSVYVPSPLRLLRIISGKTCEIEGCTKGRQVLNKAWGLFICDRCTTARTLRVVSTVFASLLSSERIVEGAPENTRMLWIQPYASADGERCGPCVTVAMETKLTPVLLVQLAGGAGPDYLSRHTRLL